MLFTKTIATPVFLKSCREDVDWLKKDIDWLKEDVTPLKEDVDWIKEEVDWPKEDVASLQEDVDWFKEDVKGRNRDVASLKVFCKYSTNSHSPLMDCGNWRIGVAACIWLFDKARISRRKIYLVTAGAKNVA